MPIELVETNPEVQLQATLLMADLQVEVQFYSKDHCTVLVTYMDREGNTKTVFTVHRDKEVRAVEAALRIATNFDSLGSEEDYKLAESIMPGLSEARWIA